MFLNIEMRPGNLCFSAVEIDQFFTHCYTCVQKNRNKMTGEVLLVKICIYFGIIRFHATSKTYP